MLDDARHPSMFEDVPVIGELPPRRVAAKLRRMGDVETADDILANIAGRHSRSQLFGWGQPRPWQHATHQFGYLAPVPAGVRDPQRISYAGTIAADETLKNSRINIHLQRLRVYDYPGGGVHQVLFTFKAQNQVPRAPEPVSFSQTYRVPQGELAGIAGYPVLIGLNVGTTGAAFQCHTVNVKNQQDQAVLNFLDSPPFHTGLNLLNTVQPALRPFTEMTLGLAKTLAQRNNNAPVQDFYLGLDFRGGGMGARLAEGDYFAVQVPSEVALDWDDWVFKPSNGTIVSKPDATVTLPYNYVVFHVSRHQA